VLYPKSSPAVK
jgi:hypothetical protein